MIAAIIAIALAASTTICPVEMDEPGYGVLFKGNVYWPSNISHVIVEIKDCTGYAWESFTLYESGEYYGDEVVWGQEFIDDNEPWYVKCTAVGTSGPPYAITLQTDGPNYFPEDFVFTLPYKIWIHYRDFCFPKV